MKLSTAFKYFLPGCILSVFAIHTYGQDIQADSAVPATQMEKYIAFGKQKTTFITGAISTVKGKSLRPAFTNNISNTLFGRLSGLMVTQGGNEPGANSANIAIRGINTFGFSSSPLVIVDGFLGEYEHLVPEEIEEISVLKDAAATAIYGMRGANGVVLITTKKGRVQPLELNFTAQYGIQGATSLPKFLNSYDYASMYNEALVNDGKSPLYTQADLDLYKSGADPLFHPNVNWYDEVFRKTAPLSNFNLNFNGGNNTVTYYAMLNALTTEGLYKKFGNDYDETSNATYSRYNFRGNIDVALSKRLSAQLILGGSVEDRKSPGDLSTGNTFALIDRISPNAFPVLLPNGGYAGNSTYSGNPLANLSSTGFSSTNGTTLQSSLRLTQKLDMVADGLSANVAVSFNNYYQGASNKRKAYQRFAVSKNTAGDTVYTSFGQRTSLANEESVVSQFRNYSFQAALNYDKVFGSHGLNGLVIFNTDNTNINRNYPGTDVANQAFPYKTNSVSTRVTYINSEKYIAEFAGSYMGAENFAPGKRYGFFPAVSLGWIVSGEKFLQQNKLIDFLKVRASYGIVGNENIGGARFGFAQRYPSLGSYYFGTGNTGANTIAEGRRANPDLTWEKEKKANLGIDLSLAKRVTITLDVFKNDRYDILTASTGVLPAFLGFNGFPDQNLGENSSKGFEFSLKYSNDTKRPFNWFAEGMVSYAKNEIVYNAEATQINAHLNRTGTSVGQPFGLEAIGLFQSDAEIAASATPVGIVVKPGDIRYRDIGGPNGVPDGVIDNNDATAIGKGSLPDWMMGLHTGFAYKGFDLELMFQGVAGVTQYLSGNRYHAFQNNGQVSEIALDRWTPQNPSATYPRLSSDNNQNNYRFSSFWQRDGSFIKLRSAEIGYTFSDKFLSRLRIDQSRVFINGTNLFTFDKIKGGDAEAYYGYPQMRTVSIGLKLQLK